MALAAFPTPLLTTRPMSSPAPNGRATGWDLRMSVILMSFSSPWTAPLEFSSGPGGWPAVLTYRMTALENRKDRELLHWLSPISSIQDHADHSASRHFTSAMWILHLDKYHQWILSPIASALWIYGPRRSSCPDQSDVLSEDIG